MTDAQILLKEIMNVHSAKSKADRSKLMHQWNLLMLQYPDDITDEMQRQADRIWEQWLNTIEIKL